MLWVAINPLAGKKGYGEEQKHINWFDWYFCVAQGDSFYKTCVKEFMTKKEAHIYLTKAPKENYRYANIWWDLKSFCHTGNMNFANKISKSQFVFKPINVFWLGVMYFFARKENIVSPKRLE